MNLEISARKNWSCGPPLLVEVVGKLLDVADARIVDFTTRDLFERAPGYPGTIRDFAPPPFRGFELFHHEIVDWPVHTGCTIDPFSGLCNPLLGSVSPYDAGTMRGRPKTPKVPGFMRTILARNVQALMEARYHANATGRNS
jgi:hypothetical protein